MVHRQGEGPNHSELQQIILAYYGRAGARSPGDALYWHRCIQSMHDFINHLETSTLEVVPVPSIFARNPVLRLKKKMGVTVDVKVARKELAMMRAVDADEKWKREPLLLPHRREGKGRVEDFRYPCSSKEEANTWLSVCFEEQSCASEHYFQFSFTTFLDIFQDMLIVLCLIYFAVSEKTTILPLDVKPSLPHAELRGGQR